jgi:hypothetical protein
MDEVRQNIYSHYHSIFHFWSFICMDTEGSCLIFVFEFKSIAYFIKYLHIISKMAALTHWWDDFQNVFSTSLIGHCQLLNAPLSNYFAFVVENIFNEIKNYLIN